MTDWPGHRPVIDMLGQPVANGTVVRQVPSIGSGARWEVLLPCQHKQIFTRQAIRVAVATGTRALRCNTCKPKADRW